jgi:hypothetical protein
MATTSALSLTFVVTGLNAAGPERVNITFTQEVPTDGTLAQGSGNLNLNLSSEDAKTYFPGQRYTVALTAA